MSMRRQRLVGEIRVEDVEAETSYENVVVPIGRDDLAEAVLNLSLLSFGLVDLVEFSDGGAPLRLARSSTSSLQRRDGALTVSLSKGDLELLLAFLLVYVRDGAADVDHVDVEVASDAAEVADVTFVVDRAKPLMSGEEARRLLAGED